MIELSDIKARVKDVMYARDIRDKMVERFHGNMIHGEMTYFDALNVYFNWLAGDVTVFSGIANHGKSTFMMFLAFLRSKHYDTKWVFFSPETNPAEYFYEELMFMYLAKQPNQQKCTQKEYDEAFKFVDEHFLFVYPEDDAPTPDYIHERFHECFIDEKCNGFVTDPYNQLEHDMFKKGLSIEQYLSGYLGKCKRFALDKNGLYVIVAHPDKASVGRKKDSVDRECPDEYCLAGGAMWPNKVDNIIIVHRPIKYSAPDASDVLINIAKIKKFRVVGKTGRINIHYNSQTNRYEGDQIIQNASEGITRNDDFCKIFTVDISTENPF